MFGRLAGREVPRNADSPGRERGGEFAIFAGSCERSGSGGWSALGAELPMPVGGSVLLITGSTRLGRSLHAETGSWSAGRWGDGQAARGESAAAGSGSAAGGDCGCVGGARARGGGGTGDRELVQQPGRDAGAERSGCRADRDAG